MHVSKLINIMIMLTGIGGGVLLLPINLFLLKLNTRSAVALSNFTIFSGALANAFFKKDRILKRM